jgi:hypothetical protein
MINEIHRMLELIATSFGPGPVPSFDAQVVNAGNSQIFIQGP